MIKNSLSWINLNASVGGGTGGTSDYNQLSNRPIKTLIGTAQNPIKLWKLETGLFILNGFIQHTNELVSEGKSLFVSVVAGLSNGKYVVAAFIPFWEGQYEYILNSLSSNNYNEHQIVMMISQDDVLTLDNEKEYTPTKDYHPSTKKYVDDMIVNFREELSEMGVNEENIESLIAENRRRDIAIQALLSQGGGSKTVTIEEETHTISLDYSIDKGMATINTMEGSTLVNVATQKEKVGLSYGQDNTVNYSNEILTEQNTNVKPMLEGNTMVNYCNNGSISMGLNKEINVVDDTGKMITLDDTVDSGLVDVKVEGKTLVNLFDINTESVTDILIRVYNKNKLITNGTFTIYNKSNKAIGLEFFKTETGTWAKEISILGGSTITMDIGSDMYINSYYGVVAVWGSTVSSEFRESIIVLEGDHTDKDISYFEGLKSVGQDSDEISVLSVNENLLEFDSAFTSGVVSWGSANLSINVNHNVSLSSNLCKVAVANNSNYHFLAFKTIIRKGVSYSYKFDSTSILGNDVSLFKDLSSARGQVVGRDFSGTFVANDDYNYIALPINIEVNAYSVSDFILTKDTQVTEYTPHQSNKKQILYFNPNTQTWEKPVLREWDSIEKHSDGKYYYHKRSGEVVLNGSEQWNLTSEMSNVVRFGSPVLRNIVKIDTECIASSVKYCPVSNRLDDSEGITIASDTLYCKIEKSKLSTQDVQGFKQWLQANPVTVVYQLAKEEVYECTNLDLITYSGETNLIVNSGAIQPKLKLKVLSNVSNVVKLLQEKVSVLENKFINGLKQVLAGDMMSLAHLLYPEDFTLENDTPQVIPYIEEGDINE